MGKHDIKTDNDFYTAKVKRLEAENAELKLTVKALESEVARLDKIIDRNKEDAATIIANRNAEIKRLKEKIVKLVNAYV